MKMLRVPDESAGKKAKCPNCAAVVPIPAAQSPTAQSPTAQSPAEETDEYKTTPSEEPTRDQPRVNPFAEAAAGGGSGPGPLPRKTLDPENPYASPVGEAVKIDQRAPDDSRRTGPPWEREGQSAGTFGSTVSQVFGQTEYVFRTMRRHGGYGGPMGFAVVGQMIGTIANMAYQFLLESAGNGQDPAFLASFYCGLLVVMPVIIIIGLFFWSFLHHLVLMLAGGTEGFHEFETTFRVIAYCSGSTSLLALIPVCGGCIQLIVLIVFTIIGLAAAHETSTGKAIAATLLPFILCIAGAIGLGLLAVGIEAAAG
jgi:hypothetical protein